MAQQVGLFGFYPTVEDVPAEPFHVFGTIFEAPAAPNYWGPVPGPVDGFTQFGRLEAVGDNAGDVLSHRTAQAFL